MQPGDGLPLGEEGAGGPEALHDVKVVPPVVGVRVERLLVRRADSSPSFRTAPAEPGWQNMTLLSDVQGKSAFDMERRARHESPARRRALLAVVVMLLLVAFLSVAVVVWVSLRGNIAPNRPSSAASTPCNTVLTDAACRSSPAIQTLPPCGGDVNATKFVVLGNPGDAAHGCAAGVAALTTAIERQFGRLAFVAASGNVNYPTGAASTMHANVDARFEAYLQRDPPAALPRFFPSMGDVDFEKQFATWPNVPFLQRFDYLRELGGPPEAAGSVYRVQPDGGLVELFVLNSNFGNPLSRHLANTTRLASLQRDWLKTSLRNSSATWKVVMFHHAPHTSAAMEPKGTWMRWPFAQWGANLVLSGHPGVYERLQLGSPEMTYVVNGLGGHPRRLNLRQCSVVEGSRVRYSHSHGALLAYVDEHSLRACFYSVAQGGTLVDAFTVSPPRSPQHVPAPRDAPVAVA